MKSSRWIDHDVEEARREEARGGALMEEHTAYLYRRRTGVGVPIDSCIRYNVDLIFFSIWQV